MALQSSPSSSSSSTSSDEFDYDVFLSFRGSDTRYNFTGNLYKALCDRGIRTFIDDRELQGGEEITPALFKYIEDSRIFIPVFSKNYASSSFCLDELVHIIDCSKAKDRLILPVFYDVEPTHLRHQTEGYGEAITNHEEKFQNDKEKYLQNMERLQKWKMALNQAANFSGHTFNLVGKEYEYKFIEKIVDLVSNKISRTLLHVTDYRVGLESRVLQVKSLLNLESDSEVCMVGIHGIGGMGKTTLAREIYNSISKQFDVLCFLDDVRQKTHQHLQETLLHETIGERGIKLGSVGKGISIIKKRLRSKKLLLILDDVDKSEQLHVLAGGHDWFGAGSRVIITTRDKHLLESNGIERRYEVEELNEDEALKLLRWKAFKNNKIDSSYEDILNRAVTYASGLPLALEVVGSSLCGKQIGEWESTLARYKRSPHKKIQTILKVSFDALEEDEQSVFLDIACFFKGYELSKIEDILDAHYGDCMKYHIGVLVEKSLVKIMCQWGDTICVTLHDLIEDMGKNIVRQESPKEPGKRSRLWLHKDIFPVLKNNTGSSKIEIIYMACFSTDAVRDLNKEAFKKMTNLKTLIISGCHSHFLKGLIHFPNSLRILQWEGYPFKLIPSIFLSKKFENMTILKFDFSENLTNICDVSGLPKLEIFSFRFCVNLITIHKSVGFLNKLKILDVLCCYELNSFPPIVKLPSLQVLRLSHCKSLESFPKISGEIKNITELVLEKTSIKELPSSIKNLTGLRELRITGDKLRVPISSLTMSKLSRVILEDCQLLPIENDIFCSKASSNVKFLRLKFCDLSDEVLQVVLKLFVNVEELQLDSNPFTTIPECLEECRFLRRLVLANCWDLQEIRWIPPNLKYLDAERCNSFPSSLSRSMLMNQKLHENGGTAFSFPSRTMRIPEWFDHQTKGSSISFWFRKTVPSIALFIHGKTLREDDRFSFLACMTINGIEYPRYLPEEDGGLINDVTYLFDVKLQDGGLGSELDEAILKNEWIHAEVVFYGDPEGDWKEIFLGSGSNFLFIESGIHVFKKKTSMEDIRFTSPYEGKRKSDECLICSLPHFFEEGWVTVNCDAVLSSYSNDVVCVGILRDHFGSFLGGFAGKLGKIPIRHADLKAIIYGIQFSCNKGYRKIIVESRSQYAIKLLKKEFSADLSCSKLVKEKHIFSSFVGQVVWRHTLCAGTKAVDVLAELGSEMSCDRGLVVF